jgi:hypothetical protein
MAIDRDRAVTTMQDLAARVAAVVGLIQFTVWGLALIAAFGISTFVVAVGLMGDWSRDALVFALVVGAATAIAPVILVRFGVDLGPIRRLPEVSAAEMKAAAGTISAKLRTRERRFVEAHGLGRVLGLGGALWDLRKDVVGLKEGGLAPAAALVETLVPSRLIRVGISALVAPVAMAIGMMSLLYAVITT